MTYRETRAEYLDRVLEGRKLPTPIDTLRPDHIDMELAWEFERHEFDAVDCIELELDDDPAKNQPDRELE